MLPERVCNTCTQQQFWGCDARDTGKLDEYGVPIWKDAAIIPLVIDGKDVWRCPRRPIKDDPDAWGRLLFHFALYQKGHLTDDGGIPAQSFKCLQMFGLIEDTLHECRENKQAAEDEKRRRHAVLNAQQR